MRLFAAFALLVSLAHAQTSFRELGRFDHLPADRDGVPVVELADVSGDGNLDLVSVHGRGLRVLLGSSAGTFTESVRIDLAGGSPVALAIGDVDGDGDVDIVYAKWIVNQDTSAKLLVNDGKGKFTAGSLPFLDRVATLAFGDVDGDRDLDLFVGRGNGFASGPGTTNRLLLNDGKGRFSVSTSFPTDADNPTAAAFVDVDRDNDLDLIVANTAIYLGPGPQNTLYLGDGAGGFSLAPSGSLPADLLSESGLATGDVNGDGNVDFVVSNSSATRPEMRAAHLFLGDGKGKFTEAASGVEAGLGSDVELVDVDGDGDLDLLVVRFGGTAGPQLYLNDGKGSFTRGGTGLEDTKDQNTSVASGDVDRNGRVDFVTGNDGERNRLYLGIDKLKWLDATTPVRFGSFTTSASRWNGFELHDLNGDGALDLLEPGTPLKLELGNAKHEFTDVTTTHLPALTGRVRNLWVADCDRDGDLDVFVHLLDASSYSVRLLVNRGTGRFDLAPLSAIPFTSTVLDLTIDDLDTDGHVDLVVDSYGGPFLFRGDSKHSFTPDTRSTFDSSKGLSPHRVADVDNDGDLDLVYKTNNHLPTDEFQVYANDGRGVFSLLSTVKLSHFRVVDGFDLVDVDGDKAVDLAIADKQPALHMGDGKGGFSDETAKRFPLPTSAYYSQSHRFADYDDDGDPDLLVAIHASGANELRYFTNTGGVFQDTSAQELGAAALYLPLTRAVHALDFDADQDIDLVFYSEQGNMVLTNLYRQTHEPHVLGLGRKVTIEVFSRAKAATQVALVQVAAGAANIPIDPFGRLQVDLATLVLLPPQLIPATGHLELVLPAPSDPRLVGLELHTQSLLVTGPVSAWRYTNLAVSNPLIQ